MDHVVFGTAGHIDHGKTTLVKALTGTDCDRLPEERERGITIELGFAQMSTDGVQLHFVDVPGHERLVHTMIAGASGIDLALLVVAADEGIMPQTREHLDVIRLMGVPGGAVALTKIDTVDDELAELAAEEVREMLAGTAFDGAPVVPVSAATGQGLDELRAALVAQARAARPRQIEDRPFREAVDRVFSLTGAGTIVTGTSLWGRLEVGADVLVMPRGLRARVRRLHVHGDERARVEAGERVAVNLVGIAREELRRGDQLLAVGDWRPTRLVTLRLELLATAPHPLGEGEELELHAFADRLPARVDRLSRPTVAPGESAVAQLRLREPMLLFPGDRVVLRRPAPVNTFAGGVVLDSRIGRWRRRDSAELERLPSPTRPAWPDLLGWWIERAGLEGATAHRLAARLGVLDGAVEGAIGRLLEAGTVMVLPTNPATLVSAARVDRLTEAARAELERRFADLEVSVGVPTRDFSAALLPKRAGDLTTVYLEELRQRGVLELNQGRVVPPGSDRHMSAVGEELARRVEVLYREAGFDAPSPADAAAQLEARPAMVEGICTFLVQRGRLVRLDGKFLVHRAALDEVAAGVRAWGCESFDVGEFKQRFGLTRKLAIPLLEWLDSERVTVRAESRRKILKRS
ncbi:MAG: selenocysteine-specific translation elongation factor [Thermoanaerobaculales bacterium]|jgi:selenocysteine-specific elongation factor|nr:selenocysteine-specific translation elongation factor [Thermoanaerobaculales bacterium]